MRQGATVAQHSIASIEMGTDVAQHGTLVDSNSEESQSKLHSTAQYKMAQNSVSSKAGTHLRCASNKIVMREAHTLQPLLEYIRVLNQCPRLLTFSTSYKHLPRSAIESTILGLLAFPRGRSSPVHYLYPCHHVIHHLPNCTTK